jgi:hypothetical protein
MNPRAYRENHAKFLLPELAKYQGQWVAFSLDGARIIASSEDLGALDRLIIGLGENPEQVALERIDLDDVCLGERSLVDAAVPLPG